MRCRPAYLKCLREPERCTCVIGGDFSHIIGNCHSHEALQKCKHRIVFFRWENSQTHTDAHFEAALAWQMVINKTLNATIMIVIIIIITMPMVNLIGYGYHDVWKSARELILTSKIILPYYFTSSLLKEIWIFFNMFHHWKHYSSCYDCNLN